MPHIHTEPGQHDHTASAYIVRIDQGEPKILLHKHKKTGLYQQFGGHVELNENPWQTVVRELEEESGYIMSQLKILQPHDRIKTRNREYILHPMPVSHNTHAFDDNKTHSHTDVAYAFLTDQEPAQPLAEGESDDFILLTRQELTELPIEKTREGIKDTALFVFDTCLHKWEAVITTEFSK